MKATGWYGLVEGTAVQLDLGGGCEVLDCAILGFVGPAMLLVPRAGRSERAGRRLAAGASAELLVEDGVYLHALRGDATAAGDAIAVRVTDDFRLSQRRWWSRAEIEVSARLVPQGGGPAPAETTTADVSAGGVQVRRPAGMPVWPRYELTLSGDPLAETIVAEAVPARVLPDFLGLRFTSIDPASRQVLTELVLHILAPRSPSASR